MKELLRYWFKHFAYAGCLPSDTESEQLSKAILVSIPTGISLLSVFWVSGYLVLDRPLSAAIPGSYAVFSLLSVFIFFKTKHYGFFRFSQLFLILWLPFLLQWSLGGFNNGSVVMLWAILSPIGALMFHGVRQAIPWFLAYLTLTVVSGVLDGQLSATVPPLPAAVTTVFYVMNIACATLLMYIVVIYFVTANKQIISALSEEKAKVEEQSQKLIEMDRVKSSFFSNISHEFRTPLTLIIGPLEDCLAGTASLPKTQLRIMLKNCRHLLRLINQLLDISKLEAGAMKLTVRQRDLKEYLSGIVRSFTPLAERKGIQLQVRAKQGNVESYFDSEKLEKVFYNLLSNAFHFTPEGGKILLTVSAVAGEHGDEWIQVTVKDTGGGIPQEEISHIFDRFYQVDGSATREHEGTGIGLALVKDLVSLHGGKIDVKSELGFGTEISVTLPTRMDQMEGAVCMEENDPATETERDQSVTPGAEAEIAGLEQDIASADEDVPIIEPVIEAANGARETVLVVDDNPDIRTYLHACLTPTYRVTQAVDGVQGLQIIKETPPDLIICDIMMPKMDGYDVCRSLKADTELKHIPLILLTAKASEGMKVEGLEAGADDYIAKPFNSKELVARVKNLLVIHRQQRDLVVLNEQLEAKVKEQLESILKSKRLARYFPNKMLERILSSEDEVILSSERRKITVFFSDLKDFSELSDRLEPEKVTNLLNEYFAEMVKIIVQYGATLDKFMGDGLMVMFGAPDAMDDKDQAQSAVSMAVFMQQKLSELGKKWLDSGIEHDIQLRIGIHQDYATVGNFGSEQLIEYTAIGKGVNLASRLEASCTPGSIKVSYPVYMLTKDRFSYEEPEEEKFKGFIRPLRVSSLDPKTVSV